MTKPNRLPTAWEATRDRGILEGMEKARQIAKRSEGVVAGACLGCCQIIADNIYREMKRMKKESNQ